MLQFGEKTPPQLETILNNNYDAIVKYLKEWMFSLNKSTITQVDRLAQEIQARDGFFVSLESNTNQVGNSVQQLIQNEISGISQQIDKLQNDNKIDLAELHKRFSKLDRQFNDERREIKLIEYALREFVSLTKIATRLEDQQHFYAKALGLVLEQNIKLVGENASPLVADQLNSFFREGLTSAESLVREVTQRAEAVNTAFINIVEIARSLNPTACDEMMKHTPEVSDMATQLRQLHNQLESRELTLQVRVSAGKDAEFTFFDELGRAIEREIEKLRNLEAYYSAKLKKLVEYTIPRIADTCDLYFRPRSNNQLEKALSDLFNSAGVESILPKPGDPYQAAEQSLRQAVPGSAGQRETVAEVTRRGFKDADGKILRRAEVRVYL